VTHLRNLMLEELERRNYSHGRSELPGCCQGRSLELQRPCAARNSADAEGNPW